MGGTAAWIGYFLATSPWRAAGPGAAAWVDVAFGGAALALVALTGSALSRVLGRPDYLPDRAGAIRSLVFAMMVGAVWAPLVGRHPSAALALAALLAVAAAVSAWRSARVDGRASLMLLPGVFACLALLAIQVSLVLAPDGATPGG